MVLLFFEKCALSTVISSVVLQYALEAMSLYFQLTKHKDQI